MHAVPAQRSVLHGLKTSFKLHFHRIIGLVRERARNGGEGEGWPKLLLQAAPSRPEQMALELLKERELRRVLPVLARSAAQPLLMKGAAVAYTHYPSPHLRPRFDTDLLIPEHAVADAWETLKQHGYERADALPGKLVFYELVCSRRDELGLKHIMDVHWRLSRHQLLAGRLSYEELARDAVAPDPLGPEARSLGPVHGLLVALMHRVAHAPYGEGNRLIWLYDIHLFSAGMLPPQWEQFAELACAKALCRISLDGLLLARDTLHTPIPPAVLSRLAAAATEAGPPAAYLHRRPWQTFVVDLRALSSWRRRLELAREHLLPPREYMRKKYNTNSCLLLPFLYVHRILTGMWKYL